MAIDDEVAIFGSGNMDTQSWHHSQEVNLVVSSPMLVKVLIYFIFIILLIYFHYFFYIFFLINNINFYFLIIKEWMDLFKISQNTHLYGVINPSLPASPKEQIKKLLSKHNTIPKINNSLPSTPRILNNSDAIIKSEETYVIDGKHCNNFNAYYNTLKGIYSSPENEQNINNTQNNNQNNNILNSDFFNNPSSSSVLPSLSTSPSLSLSLPSPSDDESDSEEEHENREAEIYSSSFEPAR